MSAALWGPALSGAVIAEVYKCPTESRTLRLISALEEYRPSPIARVIFVTDAVEQKR
jgi:hypothetical protein